MIELYKLMCPEIVDVECEEEKIEEEIEEEVKEDISPKGVIFSRNGDEFTISPGHLLTFLKKYNSNPKFEKLNNSICNVIETIFWIKDNNYEHEQFALDYADALNELSVAI